LLGASEAEIEKGSNVFLSRTSIYIFAIEDRTDESDIVFIAYLDLEKDLNQNEAASILIFDKLLP